MNIPTSYFWLLLSTIRLLALQQNFLLLVVVIKSKMERKCEETDRSKIFYKLLTKSAFLGCAESHKCCVRVTRLAVTLDAWIEVSGFFVVRLWIPHGLFSGVGEGGNSVSRILSSEPSGSFQPTL